MLNGWEMKNKKHKTSCNKAPPCGIPYGHDVFNVHPSKLRDFELLSNSWQIRRSLLDD
jgi:hypothetical protein